MNTIRTECLDEFVIFGERHLRYLIGTSIDHYLTDRYHQGLGGQLIRPPTLASNDNGGTGAIQCRSKLGGLLDCCKNALAGLSSLASGEMTSVHGLCARADA